MIYGYEIPSHFEDNDGNKTEALCSGSIHVRVPRYRERLAYIKQCGLKVNKEGSVEFVEDAIDSTIKMLEILEKHVERVEVSIEDVGVISKFEDLEVYQECEAPLNDLAGKILGGFHMGKQRKPS